MGGVRVRDGRRRCGRLPQGDDGPLARVPPPRSPGESSLTRRALGRRAHLVDFVRSRSWRVSPRCNTRRRCRMASSDWVTAAWLGRPVGVTRLSATIPDAERRGQRNALATVLTSLRPGTASSEFVLHSGRGLPRARPVWSQTVESRLGSASLRYLASELRPHRTTHRMSEPRRPEPRQNGTYVLVVRGTERRFRAERRAGTSDSDLGAPAAIWKQKFLHGLAASNEPVRILSTSGA